MTDFKNKSNSVMRNYSISYYCQHKLHMNQLFTFHQLLSDENTSFQYAIHYEMHDHNLLNFAYETTIFNFMGFTAKVYLVKLQEFIPNYRYLNYIIK